MLMRLFANKWTGFQAKKQARKTTKSFYFLLNTNVPETNNIYISEINDSSVHSFHSFF